MKANPFPPPDDAALAHGAKVAEHVRALIDAAGGGLPFADYMEAVLYAPGLGYYGAGAHKLGEGGDFVTAPEVSSLFGRCLARQYADLHASGIADIVEIGAGSGRLAVDLLLECTRLGVVPDRYLILEVSADLRARQRALLEALAPSLLDRVMWCDTLPVGLEALVLANEVLDALPVDRFRRTEDGVEEVVVVRTGERLGWATRPAGTALIRAVADIEAELGTRLRPGYTSEVCLRLPAWVASVADALSRGAVLFMDYGMSRREYYSPERDGGTLRCHYRHQAHDDPFVWPGLQDLTAQVDFTAVAEAGVAAGLAFAGYTTQAHLLIGCGIEGLLAEPVSDERQAWVRSQQAQRLMLPGEMGEQFKAMGFTRDLDVPLRAFSSRDFSDRL